MIQLFSLCFVNIVLLTTSIVFAWQPAEPELILKHDDTVYGATWSTDETRILSWSWDGTVRVWDATTGEEHLRFVHDDKVYDARWSADESYILSWSADGIVHLWDVATGQAILTLEPKGSQLAGASWYAGETQILTWTESSVEFWDQNTGTLLQRLDPDELILQIAWNEPQPYLQAQLVTAHPGGKYNLWDVEPGVLRAELTVPGPTPNATNYYNRPAARWTTNRMFLMTWPVFDEGLSPLAVWERHAGSMELSTTTSESACLEQDVLSVELNSDETILLVGGIDALQVCTLNGLEPLLQITTEAPILHTEWNQDETLILSQYYGRAEVRDAATGELLLVAMPSEGGVKYAAWSPDERRIMVVTDGVLGVVVYDANTGVQLAILPHNDGVQGAKWSADGTQILTWSIDKGLVQV